jgi:hypothetical protein
MRNSLTQKPEIRELIGAELEAVTGAAALLQTSILSKHALALRDDLVAFIKKAKQGLPNDPFARS